MITTDIEIFLGLDVGKTDHWACAVTQDGKKLWNKTLPNDEAKFIEGYQELLAQGTVLVGVDQPATIGALGVAVAQQLGIPVAYLPGLTMRRIADMYPGTAITDEEEATLGMLTGFDLDLARQITQTSNRIRGLFAYTHPALGRVIGPWLEHDTVLEALAAWPTPAMLKHAGEARIDRCEAEKAASPPAHRLDCGRHGCAGRAKRHHGRHRCCWLGHRASGPPDDLVA